MSYSNALKLIVDGIDWIDYLEEDDDNGLLGFTLKSSTNPLPDYYYTDSSHANFTSFYEGYVQTGTETAITSNQADTIRYFLLDSTDSYRVSFSDVSGLDFEEINGPGNYGEIFIFNADLTSTVSAGTTVAPASHYDTNAGDLVLDNDEFITQNQSQVSKGQQGYLTILHELAHSIGLDHAKTPQLSQEETTLKYTIMGQNIATFKHPEMDASVFPLGLQLYDIAAIQEIYGRNYETRDTDTTYDKVGAFASTKSDGAFIYTIWDGGGTDKIDASAYSTPVQIDLRQGHFSSIGRDGNSIINHIVAFDHDNYDAGNVAIAYYTVIEDATGTDYSGNGGDILIGNAWNNELNGGDGDDRLYGDGFVYDGQVGFIEEDSGHTFGTSDGIDKPADDHSGTDTLNGGDGKDFLSGGAGDDILDGGDGEDTADYSHAAGGIDVDLSLGFADDGDGGTDSLYSIENIRGSTHGDTITGDDNSNWIFGSLGSDTIEGGDDFSYYGDVVDYSDYKGKLNITATVSGYSVAKEGSDGTDTLTGIETIFGTAKNDTFSGTDQTGWTSYLDTYAGGAGSDKYIFDLSVDQGRIIINDGSFPGIDNIKFTNYDSGMTGLYANMTIGFSLYESNNLSFNRYNATTDTYTSFLQINFDPEHSYYGSSTDTISFGSKTYRYADLHALDDAWSPDTITLSELNQYVYNVGGWATGTGGTGPGGGMRPQTDGLGNFTAVEINPSSGGTLVDPAYAQELDHVPVVTDYVIATNHSSMTYETYTKEINFYSGITQNDVRFTVDGNQGSATLTVHIDALDYSFDVVDFEAGHVIDGLFFLDGSLQSQIQDADGSTLISTSTGHYNGDYDTTTSGTFGVTPTSIEVTYFLEAISFANSVTIDMQDSLTFQGTDAGELLYGLDSRGDTVYGLEGNDTIYAFGGDDTLEGGEGNDGLAGGEGDDTYVFSQGDGADAIAELANEGADAIELTDLDSADVRMWIDNAGYFHLVSKLDDTDSIVSYNGTLITDGNDYNSNIGDYIESITFSDSVTWDLTSGLIEEGTDSADLIFGSANNDTIAGDDGDDSLYGSGGDDTLIGGEGNDSLYGGTGDDTYVFAQGNDADTISEYADEGNDTIELSNLASTQARMWIDNAGYFHVVSKLDPDDTIVSYNGTLVTSGNDYNGDIGDYIENITFSDSVTWDLTSGLIEEGTDSADLIFGTAHNDTISGDDGADSLYGGSGNDTLIGGEGNDSLYGGSGDDTYVFSQTNDTDTISEYADEGDDTIQLTDLASTDVRMWIDNAGYFHVVSKLDPDDTIVSYNGTLVTSGNDYNGDIGDYIENILFSDSITWDLTGGLIEEGTDSADLIYGTAHGDTISGDDGNDSLYSGSGNDILIGDEGNDSLYGGTGNDTYRFSQGDGTDTVSENVSEGNDTIQFIDLASTQVRMWIDNAGYFHLTSKLDSDDAIISYNSTLVTNGSDYNSNIASYIETITFSDSVTWTLANGLIEEGSSSGDLIYASSGNDTILGAGGNDTIYGGTGNDTLTGGTGDDSLYGGAGDDAYVWGSGDGANYIYETCGSNDTIKVSSSLFSENITFSTSGNNLVITAGSDSITIYDQLNSSAPNSKVEHLLFANGVDVPIASYNSAWQFGTSGVDAMYGDVGGSANDVIFGRGGNDAIHGYNGNDTLIGETGDDRLWGGNGNDTLFGSSGADTLEGEANNDTLRGGTGADTLKGGTGDDTYVFAAGDGADSVVESASEGTDVIRLTGYSASNIRLWTDSTGAVHLQNKSDSSDNITISAGITGTETYESKIGSYVESIVFDDTTTWSLIAGLTVEGSSSGDYLFGTAYADTINGLAGADNLFGNTGNDTINGGDGDDKITGGIGNDTLDGGSGNDSFVFRSGDGHDVINNFVLGADKIDLTSWLDVHSTSDLTITSKTGYILVDLGGGNDISVYLSSGSALTSSEFTFAPTGINGTSGNDTLSGTSSADTLNGLAGNDTLTGAAGNDALNGGSGNDTYVWAAGAGADTILDESGTDKIMVGTSLIPENLAFSIVNSVDFKITSLLDSNDSITITDQMNTAMPDHRVESMEFADGFVLPLNNYSLWLFGTSGVDALYGDQAGAGTNDVMFGGAGNDTVRGYNGNDILMGDAGTDTIYGSNGGDTPYGGSGNDTLYGDAGNDTFMFDVSTASSDTITDFNSSEDILDLSHLITAYDPLTDAITDFVEITDSGSNSIVKVDLDGTGSTYSFVQVATLTGVTGLTDEAALVTSGHLIP